MIETTMLLPDLVPLLDWRLALPALALPAAMTLPFAARRGSAVWLQLRLRLLPRDRYRVLHRPDLPVGPDGDRVEHVVLSRQGVFLIQVVDRAGRIAGNPEDKVWTQKFPGGSSAFHNPLRLGRRRASALAAMMGIDPNALFTVVVFTGQCRFDRPMPANLTGAQGCVDYIAAHDADLLDDDELARIQARFEAGLDPRWQDKPFKTRHAFTAVRQDPATRPTAEGEPSVHICPRCGAALGAYSYKTGHRAGQMFSGCTRFPACGYRAYPVRKKAIRTPATA